MRRAAPFLTLLAFVGCILTPGTTDDGTSGKDPSASSSSSSGATASSSSSSSSGGTGSSSSSGGFIQSVISGRVLAPSGSFGLFDAIVAVDFVSNGEMVHRQTHTRFDGSFDLRGLPAGTYTLEATRGRYSGTTTATLAQDGGEISGVNIQVGSGGVRFDVVSGSYDDVGEIVHGLGFIPVEVDGEGDIFGSEPPTWLNEITDADTLDNADAIFINCGVEDEIWALEGLEEKRQALRAYVENGGSIYASDWAYDVVEWLYPEALDFHGDDVTRDSAQHGRAETVLAGVTDLTLEKLVGRAVEITYDLGSWALLSAVETPETAGLTVDVLVRGTVHTTGGTPLDDVPLAVVIHHGQGRVLYTTFHNEAQLNDTMLSILRYMVLSL